MCSAQRLPIRMALDSDTQHEDECAWFTVASTAMTDPIRFRPDKRQALRAIRTACPTREGVAFFLAQHEFCLLSSPLRHVPSIVADGRGNAPAAPKPRGKGKLLVSTLPTTCLPETSAEAAIVTADQSDGPA